MNRKARMWLIGAVAAAVLLVVLAVGIGVLGSENGKQFDAVPVLRTEEELRAAMENTPALYILEGVPLRGGDLKDGMKVLPEGQYLHIQYIHQEVEYDPSDDGRYEWETESSRRVDAQLLYLWENIPLQGDWTWENREEVKHYPTGKTSASRGNERYIISYVPDGVSAALCVRAGNQQVEIAKPCDNGECIVMVEGTLKSFRAKQLGESMSLLAMVSAFPGIMVAVCLVMYSKKRNEPVKPDRTL